MNHFYLTLALCSGFISHMISMKWPYNFDKNFFPYGILSWKYSTCTSNVVTYISLYASIIHVVNSDSSNTVGDAIIYPLLKYCLCLFTFAHVLTFMVPSLFFFIIFTTSSAFHLSELYSTSGFIAATAFFPRMAPSSNCSNYFKIAATDI